MLSISEESTNNNLITSLVNVSSVIQQGSQFKMKTVIHGSDSTAASLTQRHTKQKAGCFAVSLACWETGAQKLPTQIGDLMT